MIPSILLLLAGSLCIFGTVRWFYNQRKLRKTIDRMPGPRGHPIFGILLDLMVQPDQLWNCIRKMGQDYYPIYRYWQVTVPVVNLICPEDIEIVLSTTKHITKGLIYDTLHAWLGTGLLTSTGSKWQQRRKILTPSFHFNILQQFIPIFVEEGELLVQQLQEECEKPYTDVVPLITQSTLNSICETAMGTRLDKKDQKSVEYTTATFKMGEIILSRLLRPWHFVNATFRLFPTYREQKKNLKILHNFSESVIRSRKVNFKETDLLQSQKSDAHGAKQRLAMLDLLISAKNAGQDIDDEGIREEVDTFIFEGHDTTTACISFTLLILANHRDIQDKVVQELNDVFGDSDRWPTYQELQSLHYLEQVLKESLRMYPSVPLISRTADEDIHTYTGYTIPENTLMQIHIYDLHHNPELYPEPEKFDPGRFSVENASKRHPFAYIPFSAGPRNCIGQKFAILEIKTIIATILRKFVLEPIDRPSDITIITHLVLKTRPGIKIKFLERRK